MRIFSPPKKRRLKVLYSSSNYYSLARVAKTYRGLISESCIITDRLEDAEVVILHHPPHRYPAIYRRYPELHKKYVVACAVWEASSLSQDHLYGLSLVQEVWTCSDYCAAVFRRWHPRVVVVPHVIERDIAYTSADLLAIKQLLRHDQETLYLLTIARICDKRKNLGDLADAAMSVRELDPRFKLIVKGIPSDPDHVFDAEIVTLREYLSEAQLNALYSLSSLYVSAHHAEGWGLSISDAILFDVPIVATEYSGNLQYLDHSTSYLIPCRCEYIRAEDCFGLFDHSMQWAYMSVEDIVITIRRAYEEILSGEATVRTRLAKGHAQGFSRAAVGDVITERLKSIAAAM